MRNKAGESQRPFVSQATNLQPSTIPKYKSIVNFSENDLISLSLFWAPRVAMTHLWNIKKQNNCDNDSYEESKNPSLSNSCLLWFRPQPPRCCVSVRWMLGLVPPPSLATTTAGSARPASSSFTPAVGGAATTLSQGKAVWTSVLSVSI